MLNGAWTPYLFLIVGIPYRPFFFFITQEQGRMASYAKLHTRIVDSSLWEEDVYTRIVFITMMAKADAQGRVYVAPSRMVKLANMTQSKYDRAIKILSSPDPHSRTPDDEGRRIVPIQGGWQLVNYVKHRTEIENEEQKERKRNWDRQNRPSGYQRKKNAEINQKTQSDTQSDGAISDFCGQSASPTQAEAEAEAEAEADKEKRDRKETRPPQKKTLFLEFVYLTEEEHQKLIEHLGDKDTHAYIERLNNYIGSKGKRYKSHYHTILNWSSKDANDTNHARTGQSHSAANRRDFDAQQSAIGETINVDQ